MDNLLVLLLETTCSLQQKMQELLRLVIRLNLSLLATILTLGLFTFLFVRLLRQNWLKNFTQILIQKKSSQWFQTKQTKVVSWSILMESRGSSQFLSWLQSTTLVWKMPTQKKFLNNSTSSLENHSRFVWSILISLERKSSSQKKQLSKNSVHRHFLQWRLVMW